MVTWSTSDSTEFRSNSHNKKCLRPDGYQVILDLRFFKLQIGSFAEFLRFEDSQFL